MSTDAAPPPEAPTSFTPEMENDYRKAQISYSYKCPGPGQYQCSVTELKFDMTQETELKYKTEIWDDIYLQVIGKMAAGLLFSIRCPDGAMTKLHLPHCDMKEDLGHRGMVSVICLTEEGMTFLEPLEITDTHAVVDAGRSAAYGLVWCSKTLKKVWNDLKPVRSKVLLFLQRPFTGQTEQTLFFVHVPTSVPQEEVLIRHRDTDFVQAPDSCIFVVNKPYSVHCAEAIYAQPKKASFFMNFGPNYHATFDIRIPINLKTTLTVRDQNKTEIWKVDVDLEGKKRSEVYHRFNQDQINHVTGAESRPCP